MELLKEQDYVVFTREGLTLKVENGRTRCVELKIGDATSVEIEAGKTHPIQLGRAELCNRTLPVILTLMLPGYEKRIRRFELPLVGTKLAEAV